MPEKVGIYVCHCGSNIAGTVDVEEVVRWAGENIEDVAVSRDYRFMCSSPGQEMIEEDIKSQGLTRVVVAACSPLLHERTFRRVCQNANLNPYLFQMANIREQVSWVTADRAAATRKAKALVAAAAERVKRHRPLEPMQAEVNPATLVVGGGIAGLQATLELADAGYPVYLVEREPSIGGHMAQFDKTFPTLDCSACILTPKMSEVGQHENVTLLSYSELEEVGGHVGNYRVKVRRKARYIDEDKCTGCGQCVERYPVRFKPVDGEGRFPPESRLHPEVQLYVEGAIELHKHERGPLISVLQDINRDLGYLAPDVLRSVSRRLEIPLSRVYHVATFYTAFSLVPRGEHVVRVCMGTACHVRGAPRVLEVLENSLGIKAGQTTEDMRFTLETVNCLGACAMGPIVAVDGKYYGQVRPGKVGQILKRYREAPEIEKRETAGVQSST